MIAFTITFMIYAVSTNFREESKLNKVGKVCKNVACQELIVTSIEGDQGTSGFNGECLKLDEHHFLIDPLWLLPLMLKHVLSQLSS